MNRDSLIPIDKDNFAQGAAAKNIAHSLSNYLTSGSESQELELLNKINENKGFVGRFFPTHEAKVTRGLQLEELRALRANRSEIMKAHHAMYIEATKLHANAFVQGLGTHLQKQLAEFASANIESVIHTVTESQERVRDELFEKEKAAMSKYAGHQKYLDAAISDINKAGQVHMEATRSLLDGTVQALKNKAGI